MESVRELLEDLLAKIPESFASEEDVAEIKAVVDTILVIVDNLPDNGNLTSLAQDSTVAKESTLNSVSSDIDVIDTVVDDTNIKVGETTDFASDLTLLGYHNSLYKHVHNPCKVYPTLTDGVVVTGGGGVWTLGSFYEVIPENTITSAFDIHYVNFEGSSASDVYELVLYSGTIGNEVEIGRVRSIRDNTRTGLSGVRIQVPVQSANSRISAKVAAKSAGGRSVAISLYYHTYV